MGPRFVTPPERRRNFPSPKTTRVPDTEMSAPDLLQGSWQVRQGVHKEGLRTALVFVGLVFFFSFLDAGPPDGPVYSPQ